MTKQSLIFIRETLEELSILGVKHNSQLTRYQASMQLIEKEIRNIDFRELLEKDNYNKSI